MQGTYFTCISFTTFFVHKQPRSQKIWGGSVLRSACQSMTPFHLAVYRDTGIHYFSLMFPGLCWSIMPVLSVLTPSWVLLWLWTQAQVNDNLNPSWVHFLSSCSSLVLVTRTAVLCVCVWLQLAILWDKIVPRNLPMEMSTDMWCKYFLSLLGIRFGLVFSFVISFM